MKTDSFTNNVFQCCVQHVPAARPATRQTAASVYAQQPVQLVDPRLLAAPLYSQAPLPAPPSPQPQLGPAAGYGAAAPFAAPPSPPSRPTSAGSLPLPVLPAPLPTRDQCMATACKFLMHCGAEATSLPAPCLCHALTMADASALPPLHLCTQFCA